MDGVFTLLRPEPGAFTPRQIELVRTFADQAVIAIENARLFDEVQAKTRDLEESLQQQTATADVLKVISSSAFDLHAVLNSLSEVRGRLCDADQWRRSLARGTASSISWRKQGACRNSQSCCGTDPAPSRSQLGDWPRGPPCAPSYRFPM